MLKTILADMEKSEPRYDIYMYDIPWLEYMVQNGLVADITEYVESSSFNTDAFFPHNLKNCMYEGRYWGIPIVGGSQIMFYRSDLFENHGIRKSFKEQFGIMGCLLFRDAVAELGTYDPVAVGEKLKGAATDYFADGRHRIELVIREVTPAEKGVVADEK